ncbi:MAG TPA: SUMF1/EgtB/PvdO family nonheme iron enzyme, partial [Candidatus Wallbacteria bacterium]|nr:SUMF1/EgtB/PvdO family nonheme iron enzyme [Candidatus Wallbacteria bacterium]
LQSPAALTVVSTATTENIFVSDSAQNCIFKYSNTGVFLGKLDKASLLSPSTLSSPGGLEASTDAEFLYVTDTNNHRVIKIKLNLTTEEIELGDDYFAIEPRYFNVNNDLATWPLGFAPNGSVEEGGHIELNVTAKKGDGSVNTAYTGTSATGKIYIDPTIGLVTWEGAGITDLGAGNTNNGAEYGVASTTFTSGVAKFYVRNTMQASALKVTIVDNTNTEMKGEVEISWTAENTPPALEFIGTNSKGFRKFICKNDPSVTFIKIPASAFDRGDGSYGGAPTEIKMSTYYIAETLTTNSQFNNWRNSPGAPALVGAWASNSGLSSYSQHPAICLQKDDARNYSYWLITGSNSGQNEMYHSSADQHEKAGRGAKLAGVGNNAAEKIWPWGNTWNTSNCNENSIQTPDERIFIGLSAIANGTTRVTRYPEMGYYGLRDITGNCWVWLRDNPNLVTGGSWYNGGLGSESYRCSFTTSHSPGFLGGKWDSVRPCFYWPVQ